MGGCNICINIFFCHSITLLDWAHILTWPKVCHFSYPIEWDNIVVAINPIPFVIGPYKCKKKYFYSSFFSSPSSHPPNPSPLHQRCCTPPPPSRSKTATHQHSRDPLISQIWTHTTSPPTSRTAPNSRSAHTTPTDLVATMHPHYCVQTPPLWRNSFPWFMHPLLLYITEMWFHCILYDKITFPMYIIFHLHLIQ